MSWIKKIMIAILVVFVIIQFVQPVTTTAGLTVKVIVAGVDVAPTLSVTIN